MPDTPAKRDAGLLTTAGRLEPPATIMALSGVLTAYSAAGFRRQAHELIEAGATHLVLDLGELTFMDSTGIGTILGIYKRMRANRGCLYLVSPGATVRKILQTTGLDRLFRIEPDLAAALADASSGGGGWSPEVEERLRSILNGRSSGT